MHQINSLCSCEVTSARVLRSKWSPGHVEGRGQPASEISRNVAPVHVHIQMRDKKTFNHIDMTCNVNV